MAVVKSTKTFFEGAPFVMRIRFSSRDGRFAITLPKAIKRSMGIDEVGSDTLNGVNVEYKRVLKEYRDSKTAERKVIVYKVEANVWVYRRSDGTPGHPHDDDDASVLFQVRDISFGDGCGLTLFAEVMVERTLQSGDKKYVSYKVVEDTILPNGLRKSDGRVADEFGKTGEDVHVIDWTPERERWFAHVGRQLEDMVMNVCKTLGDEDVALELMDSGRMLMAPREQEKPSGSSRKRKKKGAMA